uniref:WGS project CAEQ00000000 data, annotated contig 2252 n=1 Tax=Trypanosoma congolense (strain IL3000) TaxID=1068625 RepID=F9WCN7_TRYCI|nr:unnamed protein product [Trypanosoma congolense IL3000]
MSPRSERRHGQRGICITAESSQSPRAAFPSKVIVTSIRHHLWRNATSLHAPKSEDREELPNSLFVRQGSSDKKCVKFAPAGNSSGTQYDQVVRNSLAAKQPPLLSSVLPPGDRKEVKNPDKVENVSTVCHATSKASNRNKETNGYRKQKITSTDRPGDAVVQEGRPSAAKLQRIRRDYRHPMTYVGRDIYDDPMWSTPLSNGHASRTLSHASSSEDVLRKMLHNKDLSNYSGTHESMDGGSTVVQQLFPDLTHVRNRAPKEHSEVHNFLPSVSTNPDHANSLRVITTTVTRTTKKVHYTAIDEPYVDKGSEQGECAPGKREVSSSSDTGQTGGVPQFGHLIPTLSPSKISPSGSHHKKLGASNWTAESLEVRRKPQCVAQGASERFRTPRLPAQAPLESNATDSPAFVIQRHEQSVDIGGGDAQIREWPHTAQVGNKGQVWQEWAQLPVNSLVSRELFGSN